MQVPVLCLVTNVVGLFVGFPVANGQPLCDIMLFCCPSSDRGYELTVRSVLCLPGSGSSTPSQQDCSKKEHSCSER